MVKDFIISSSKYCFLTYISTVFGLLSDSEGPSQKINIEPLQILENRAACIFTLNYSKYKRFLGKNIVVVSFFQN